MTVNAAVKPKEKTKRMWYPITDDLRYKLKAKAYSEGKSVQAKIIELIKRYVR